MNLPKYEDHWLQPTDGQSHDMEATHIYGLRPSADPPGFGVHCDLWVLAVGSRTAFGK